MNNTRSKKKLNLVLDESGAVAIFVALAFAVLCGFVGLAFDIGHMVLVKAELQRTADAAAMAGVAGLVPYTGPTMAQEPDWASAVAKAHTMINNEANKADNQIFTITEGTVQSGYWYLQLPAGVTQTFPSDSPTQAYKPEPAIKVTLSRNVILSFAPLVGVSSPKTETATATAILPAAYGTTNLPPIAVSEDTVYNIVNDNLIIDVTEQDIKIQSNKGVASWFNQNGGNSVPSVRINTPLKITNPIYLVPGTKATLTDFMTEGETIVITVVHTVSQKDWEPVVGFAAFKIDTLSANSMEGHFVNQYFDPFVVPPDGTETTAPSGGVAGTPKFVGP